MDRRTHIVRTLAWVLGLAAMTVSARAATPPAVVPDTLQVRILEPISQPDGRIAVGHAVSDTVRSALRSGQTVRLSEADRTEHFYGTLRDWARRYRFWSWVHDLVIVPVRPASVMKPEVVDEAALYSLWNGRRIAAIEFERENVFDPAHSWLEKAANAVHVTTREQTVRRDLLFRVGEPFDAETVIRYKQLLRSRQYIANVGIDVVPAPTDPDAVIVRILTQDNWSISADGGAQGLSGKVWGELYDANFLGTGDRFSYRLSLDWKRGRYAGSLFRYRIPNLFGSFVAAEVTAGRSFDERYYGASVNKPLIRPTDYAVGGTFENVRNALYVRYATPRETVAGDYMVHYNHLNLWTGYSWYLPSVSSSLYGMARYDHLRWLDTPRYLGGNDASGNPVWLPVGDRLNPYFYDTDLMLGSLGLYRERFLTTSLIYGYGYNEYVATGYRAEATFGYSNADYYSGFYGGLSFRAGGFLPFGYLMGSAAVGSYYARRLGFYRSALHARIQYFTNMLGHSRFTTRQFVTIDYLKGWNRFGGFYESVWFTGRSGPRAAGRSSLGSNRIVLSTETVVFTPWQPLGFRIALYGFGDVGTIGFDPNIFRNEFQATVGIGVRLRNERLVFGTLQLSLFYNFGRSGMLNSEWIQLTSEQRLQTPRYIPSQPEVVGYQ